jgi:glycosyltransferase involved in cell wall biosynthesis
MGTTLSQARRHISVCVCTYKRPRALARLLATLQEQDVGLGLSYDVVVADNDHEASAESVVRQAASRHQVQLTYCVEPQQNIARARNRALLSATGEYVAFIDDDEIAPRTWLGTLAAALDRFEADGVLGPVLPFYEAKPPQWVTRGKFHERPSHRTGEILRWTNCRTGNVLLKRAVFSQDETMFRPEFGSGGEDSDFFRRAIARGFRFVWCAEAPVYERVPTERCTLSFMLRRALLRGQIPQFSRVDLAKSLVAVPLYSASLPFLLLTAPHLFVKYLVKDCDHIGRLCNVIGIRLVKDKYVLQ